MAIDESVAVISSALWPQGDERDPLGVWGFRLGVTGDASGDGIKVAATEVTGKKSAYIYTCYSANVAKLSGAIVANEVQCRLLTNWPNIDVLAGVQAYSSNLVRLLDGSAPLTAPIMGPGSPLVREADRFLLLFDPRQGAILSNIVELRVASNVLAETWSFEGYGYFWDRSVLNAPGGLRHPGSS